jgi:hypothetical protein
MRLRKNVFSGGPEFHYNDREHRNIDVFSGHFGYFRAASVNGDIITILRDPVDRFLSFYFYLVHLYNSGLEISERTTLAAKYSLSDFVCILDNTDLIDPLLNGAVWQIVCGTSLRERATFRRNCTPSDNDLLDIAKKHIDSFAIVGLQDDMPQFWRSLQNRYGIRLDAEKENAGVDRMPLDELSPQVRDKIERWTYMDAELFRYARGSRQPSPELS